MRAAAPQPIPTALALAWAGLALGTLWVVIHFFEVCAAHIAAAGVIGLFFFYLFFWPIMFMLLIVAVASNAQRKRKDG